MLVYDIRAVVSVYIRSYQVESKLMLSNMNTAVHSYISETGKNPTVTETKVR